MKSDSPFLIVLLVSIFSFSAALAEEAVPTPPSANTAPNSYPLTNCVVSGDKLGGPMGAPVVEHYQGEEVQFCCKDCIQDFKKDPEKYLKRLHEAEAKAKAEKKE